MSDKHLKVVQFTGGTVGEVLADKVLSGALEQLQEVVVIGYTHDGDLYVASSHGPTDVIWAIEEAKLWLLTRTEDE